MESLLNKMYKPKNMSQPSSSQQAGQQSAQQESMKKKEYTTQGVREIDSRSIASSQVPLVGQKQQHKPQESFLDRWTDTKKGKMLDTAAAFVGLPHICSNE